MCFHRRLGGHLSVYSIEKMKKAARWRLKQAGPTIARCGSGTTCLGDSTFGRSGVGGIGGRADIGGSLLGVSMASGGFDKLSNMAYFRLRFRFSYRFSRCKSPLAKSKTSAHATGGNDAPLKDDGRRETGCGLGCEQTGSVGSRTASAPLSAAKLEQLRGDIQEGRESGDSTPWDPDGIKREGRKRRAARLSKNAGT